MESLIKSIVVLGIIVGGFKAMAHERYERRNHRRHVVRERHVVERYHDRHIHEPSCDHRVSRRVVRRLRAEPRFGFWVHIGD